MYRIEKKIFIPNKEFVINILYKITVQNQYSELTDSIEIKRGISCIFSKLVSNCGAILVDTPG